MPKYRVMCHPATEGTKEFFTIETSRLGLLWTPLGKDSTGFDFTLVRFYTREAAMAKAEELWQGKPKEQEPYAVAYFPPTPMPPR